MVTDTEAPYGTLFPNKIAWCKFCDQGWMEILKEIETGRFTVVCSECDGEYDSPEDMINERNPHSYSGGRTIDPTIEEIREIGWDKYIVY